MNHLISSVLALHHYSLSFPHSGLSGTLYTWPTKRVSRSSGRTRRLSLQGPAWLSLFEIRNSRLFDSEASASNFRRETIPLAICFIYDNVCFHVTLHPTLSFLPPFCIHSLFSVCRHLHRSLQLGSTVLSF